MKAIFEGAGLPTEPEKDEGPATTVSVLGLELDSVKLEICLPADKLSHLKSSLASWQSKKVCDPLSLIGLLSHAAKAVGLDGHSCGN